jgi:large subunit ribosomal protein L9
VRVILRQRVRGLGEAGAVVQVADGYARNYLLPRGLAVEATEGELRRVAEERARAAARAERALAEAREAARRIDGAAVTVPARAGTQGRLFGSITSADVAAAIAASCGVAVDRRQVLLEEPIRSVGEHSVTVRLHPDVAARVIVRVVPA